VTSEVIIEEERSFLEIFAQPSYLEEFANFLLDYLRPIAPQEYDHLANPSDNVLRVSVTSVHREILHKETVP
jgi:hypothetical protein